MSQLRENSKCGEETHVERSPVSTTTTTSTSGIGKLIERATSSERNPGGVPDSHSPSVEISIRIPPTSDDPEALIDEDDNNNDSDPPVENYNLFQDYEDDEEEVLLDDSHPESSNIILTAQEQRQRIQRRRAGGHFNRKRKKSANIDADYVPPYKKRFRRQTSVLPSKFLLGGNIRDPLNLASLADAKVNAALNAETPKSSPLPTPAYRHGEVPVFIPKNPDDPLGLQSEATNPHDFIAGIRKANKVRKHRSRRKGRKRTDSECSIEKSEDSDGKDKDTSMSSEEEKNLFSNDDKAGNSGSENEKLEKTGGKLEKICGKLEKIAAKSEKSKVDVKTSGKSFNYAEPLDKIIHTEEMRGKSEKIQGKSLKIDGNVVQIDGKPVKMDGKSVKMDGKSVKIEEKSLKIEGKPAKIEGNLEKTDGKQEEIKENVEKIQGKSEIEQDNVENAEKLEDENKKENTDGEIPGPSSQNHPLKKKSRQRKRSRRGPYQHQFIPYYFLGKSSDYVPLGTPSVHEANFYQDYSPSGPEFSPLPFESPSISHFASSEQIGPMEPFSPPPKPEIKRRRIEPAPPSVPAIQITSSSGSAIIEKLEKSSAKIVPPSTITNNNPVIKIEASKKESPKFLRPLPPNKLVHSNHRNNNLRKRFRHKSDPIVSPVIPQPGSRRRFNQHHFFGSRKNDGNSMESSEDHSAQHTTGSSAGFKYRQKDQLFQFGNYNRYYGYRITTEEGADLRLNAFPKEIFENKQILDIGCNIGHVTMLIARDCGAKKVVGVDIDPKLIEVAKKNVKHYVDRDPQDETIRFPHSCPLMYGVLQPPVGTLGDTRKIPFPYNVSFRQENYVLESDDLLETVKPEYDLILCLSITKWIHLNNGDDGLKRFFRRIFLHLRPGGKLILEPQPWSSYKRKKKLTEQIFATFKSIRFYPDKFQDFLLKEVGFSTMEKLSTPIHSSKGFQRPLMVFTKFCEESESSPRWTPSHPQLGVVEMISVPGSSPSSFSNPSSTPKHPEHLAPPAPKAPKEKEEDTSVVDSGNNPGNNNNSAP